MKCIHCGFETEVSSTYCPNCGAQQAPAPVKAEDVAAVRILPALKDTLFLVVCILSSVCCGLSLIASGPDVISILFTVFLWLVWAQGQKNIADVNYLRCISGTMYARYVLANVAAIFVIVFGVLFSLLLNVLLSEASFVEELLGALSGTLPVETLDLLSQQLAAGMGIALTIVFVIIGVLILIFNMFSNRYIHRFAKSVYKSIESGKLELKHANATRVWLCIFGIVSGLNGLRELTGGSMLVLLSSGASCAMSIIAAILVKKYLIDTPATEA